MSACIKVYEIVNIIIVKIIMSSVIQYYSKLNAYDNNNCKVLVYSVA